jgi:hypothetical protein
VKCYIFKAWVTLRLQAWGMWHYAVWYMYSVPEKFAASIVPSWCRHQVHSKCWYISTKPQGFIYDILIQYSPLWEPSHHILILSSAVDFILTMGKFYESGSVCLDIVLPPKDIFKCFVGFWWWCMTPEVTDFKDSSYCMCGNLTHPVSGTVC